MKGISILLVAVLMTVQGFSQDFKKFKFGFKVDPNVSWMSSETTDVVSEGVLLRGSFGVNADIMFSERYALGTGFSIMGGGGQLSFFDYEDRIGDAGESNFIVKRNRKYKLKYVEIPLTLKLRTDEIGYITYWGQFGLGLGFATKATADDNIKFFSELVEDADEMGNSWIDSGSAISTLAKEDEEEMGVDISGEMLPIRASLIIGAGIDYSLSGNTSLMFGIAYNNGLTNVFKSKIKAIEINDDGNPSYGTGSGEGGRLYNEFKMKSITNSFVVTAGILF
ncbi:MAG: outer membrane beta-barrel protein [Flavobacteriales bacterium]|jgi:hypothetical protein